MSGRRELQLPDGWQGPGLDALVGEFVVHHEDDGTLTVVRADPRILISVELLEEFREGRRTPEVTVTGDVLRIEAANRTVIYRIGDEVPYMHAYYAEWPD